MQTIIKSVKSSNFSTDILAEFISGLSPDKIPSSTFEAAKKCIIDIAAASLAGFEAATTAGNMAAGDMAADLFARGSSTVWFSGKFLNSPGAAYVNSSFASALDLDDGHRKAIGHPGAAIIPAALAVAEEIGSSGIDFLAAVIIGYEVAIRVASSRDHEKLDTASSGKWCPFGVAAAGGWLYKLSPHKLAQAISIAGAHAPGLSASGYSKVMGNNVKEGIPWSTVTGLSALMLARNNFSGPLDILDHPDFYDSRQIVSGLGKEYEIENVYFKPYACCRWIHSAIDALLILMDIHDLKPEQISGIDVHLFKRALMLTNQTCPETLEGAQYSVQYSMAIAALEGKEKLCPMKSHLIGKSELISFSEKIKLYEDLELTGMFPAFAPARIVIHSIKGDFEKFVKSPLGDPANPMDLKMIEEKINLIAAQNSFANISFRNNSFPNISGRIVHAVKQLENSDMHQLSNILGHKLDSNSSRKNN